MPVSPLGRRQGPSPRPRARRWAPCFVATLAALAMLAGCGPAQQLRSWLRSEKSDRRTKKTGSLAISVEPTEGITILLDSERVAHRSPWQSDTVAPGPHVLEVRGMGRYSVMLPLNVSAGMNLAIPVRLRVRQPVPFVAPISQPFSAAIDASAQTTPSLAELPRHARGHKALPPEPLAPGVQAVRLQVSCQPPAVIRVDGRAGESPVRLANGRGRLALGAMAVTYRVLPGRIVELTIPGDEAEWSLNGQQIKASSVVRLATAPATLVRTSGPQRQQALLQRSY